MTIQVLVDSTSDVPADRVQALRRAFDATMKDPDFLAEADHLSKALRLLRKSSTAEDSTVQSRTNI